MCIAVVCYNGLPKENTLRLMEKNNPDGAGIAYVKDEYLYWIKGIDTDTILSIQNTFTFPLLLHYRLASIGGKSEKLCHPFPVSKYAETDLQGKIKGRVLIHNGHFSKWRDICLDTVVRHGKRFPKGVMSDTRAMAWLAYIYGTSVLTLFDEKIAVLSSQSGIKTYGKWQTYEEEDNKFLISNKYWEEIDKKNYWKNGYTHTQLTDPFNYYEETNSVDALTTYYKEMEML